MSGQLPLILAGEVLSEMSICLLGFRVPGLKPILHSGDQYVFLPAAWSIPARGCCDPMVSHLKCQTLALRTQGQPCGVLLPPSAGRPGHVPGSAWWNARMPTSASDQELLARQEALQTEATQVLAEPDLGQRFAGVGPVLVVGSYLSG
jgi:hypothetical protein